MMAPVFMKLSEAKRMGATLHKVAPGRWILRSDVFPVNVYDPRIWRLAGRYGPLVPRRVGSLSADDGASRPTSDWRHTARGVALVGLIVVGLLDFAFSFEDI